MRKLTFALFSMTFMLSIIVIANADSVSLIPSTNNQIYNYQININKLNDTPPIFTFLLANSTGTPYIYPASQNCTITNIVTCQAVFLKTPGFYDTILVYQNSKLYETLQLTGGEIIYEPQTIGQQIDITKVSNIKWIVGWAGLSIIIVLLLGNILLNMKKKN